jgi:hypothetical protein
MITASEVCEYERFITSFVFGTVDILGLAAPEWFFSSQSFYFINKYLVSFIFHIQDILLHTNTYLVFRSHIFIFQYEHFQNIENIFSNMNPIRKHF